MDTPRERLQAWTDGSFEYKAYRCGSCVPPGVPSLIGDVRALLTEHETLVRSHLSDVDEGS